MLLRHTLLYLPAQIVGPLFQLIAMIVWTHVVDEHTLGVITLVTATHELLQIAFLAWWSQYALRFFGRYQDEGEALRFYRTENAVMLASIILQSIIVIAVLLLVIAPDAKTGLIAATVGYGGEISFDISRPDGTPQKLLDVNRLAKLGWRARTSLPDGIRLAYQAYLNESK